MKADTARLLAPIAANYQLPPERLAVLAPTVEAAHPGDARAAIAEIVNTSRYAPTVAELRDMLRWARENRNRSARALPEGGDPFASEEEARAPFGIPQRGAPVWFQEAARLLREKRIRRAFPGDGRWVWTDGRTAPMPWETR